MRRLINFSATTAILMTFGLSPFALLIPAAHAAGDPGPDISAEIIDAGAGTHQVVVRGSDDTAGTYIPSDPNYVTLKRFVDQPCIDKNGNVSYMGVVQIADKSAPPYNHCLVSHYGKGVDIVGYAKQLVPAPKPSADYTDKFLTGAEIKFTSTDLASYAASLPKFPGVSYTITALDAVWDFGDGTKSTDLEPKHTYENIAPNESKEELHAVHVTVTGRWQVTLMNSNTGEIEDLGIFSSPGFLDRQLVQVWSQQTEPKK